MYSFVVLKERGQRAIALFREKCARLTEDQVIDVMYELGWDRKVSFGEDGKVQFALTDLQFVAVAAALTAVVEAGARKEIQA